MSQLQQEGSAKKLVEEELESEGEPGLEPGNLLEGVELETREEKKCQLCKINRPPFSAGETLYLENDDFYVVDTYNRKQHSIRNMAVQKEHGDIPPVKENVEMIDALMHITSGHIQDGEMLIFGSMGSFGEHYHLIGSDVYGEDPREISDLGDVNSYARFEVEDGEAEYLPEESRYRDGFGEYIKTWIELTDLI